MLQDGGDAPGNSATCIHDRLGDAFGCRREVSQPDTERLESIDLATHLRRRVTYPGFLPLLHLDHIYYKGRLEVRGLELRRTRRALVTSDHLPLVAELEITFDAPARRSSGGLRSV